MAPAIALLIGSAISAIPSIVQGVSGAVQRSKANALEAQYPRPDATPSEILKKLMALAYARTLDQDIPGGELYRNEIKGATASGIKAASESSSGAEAFGASNKLVQNQTGLFTDMAKLTAQRVAGAEQTRMSLLEGPGMQEEQRLRYWDKEMPYLMAQQKASELRNVGSQNIMSGIKNLAGIGSSAMFSSALMKNGLGTGGTMDNDTLQMQIDKIMKAGGYSTGPVAAPDNKPS